MLPLISVIVPSYNHAESLPGCLDAIFAQTYQPLEVIVVDDGSTDETQTVLTPYLDRIKLVTQENSGSNPARNAGYAASTGGLLIFCDADIVMEPAMIAQLYQALLDEPTASFAYCGFTFGWKTFKGVPWDAERLLRHNYIHTTSLVRRADFPGFDNSVRRLQDWDVWLTMLKNGKHGVLVPEVLFGAAIVGKSRIGTSWLPRLAYKLPWQMIGWKPKSLEKYQVAREELRKKHADITESV